jgi:hypothetical protein
MEPDNMNRRALLTIAALGAMTAVTSVDARVMDGAASAEQLLARQWRHVSTTDAATGVDLSTGLPRLSSKLAYLPDGTYLSGDSDRGSWSLSADGRTLKLASDTFEYSVELYVERLDAGVLRVTSRQILGPGGEARVVAETFAPAARQVVTAR